MKSKLKCKHADRPKIPFMTGCRENSKNRPSQGRIGKDNIISGSSYILWPLTSNHKSLFLFVTGTRGRSSWMARTKQRILETERGSTRSHSVENSLWKRLRTSRKTDYEMNEFCQWRSHTKSPTSEAPKNTTKTKMGDGLHYVRRLSHFWSRTKLTLFFQISVVQMSSQRKCW